MSHYFQRAMATSASAVSDFAIWQQQYGDLLIGIYWLFWWVTS
jgi:hypothetical protein